MNKKLFYLTILVSTLAQYSYAFDMQTAMENYMNNVANQGVVSSTDVHVTSSVTMKDGLGKTRGFEAGLGGFQMRTPNESIGFNTSFTPPAVSAGCGGIDMHMGSLSFELDTDITALLETIPRQALGYAFRLALDSLSPEMQNITASIQDAMRQLNEFQLDSCQAAQSLVDATGYTEYMNNVGAQLSRDTGNSDSTLDSQNDSSAPTINDVPDSDPRKEAFNITHKGNLLYKVLVSEDAYQKFGVTTRNDPIIKLALSLTGTTVVTDVTGEPTESFGSGSGQTRTEVRRVPYPSLPHINLDTLMNLDETDIIDLYTCNDWATSTGATASSADDVENKCLTLTVEATTNTKGFKQRIIDAFDGTASPADGIFAHIRLGHSHLGAGSLWTAEEKRIWAMLPPNMAQLLIDAIVFAPDQSIAFIEKNSSILAREVAKSFIVNLLNVVETAAGRAEDPDDGIQQLIVDIRLKRKQISDEYEAMVVADGSFLDLYLEQEKLFKRVRLTGLTLNNELSSGEK